MRVIVSLEHHFDRTPDGVVWTQTQFPYRFWQRYLEVFDQVRVVARVRDAPRAAPDWQRADGRHVSFAAIPEYLGPRQYLLRFRQIRAAARSAIARRMRPFCASVRRSPACSIPCCGVTVVRMASRWSATPTMYLRLVRFGTRCARSSAGSFHAGYGSTAPTRSPRAMSPNRRYSDDTHARHFRWRRRMWNCPMRQSFRRRVRCALLAPPVA